ncbi:MAG: glycosyltransferase family 2 protein [Thermodesulfobacteriota bacterium]|nr:glycosyltransferase family 2 protein [Thermodesulfobacteriota bacterium]
MNTDDPSKKIIIQIPCYNEENTLSATLKALPRTINNIHPVEWLIIDDGSTDKTSEVARSFGVDHVVSHYQNLGLARAFMTGIEACIERGADIIVNTDADNQYNAECIPDLVNPILNNEAEIVIGARPIQDIAHFSTIKKLLQRLGTWAVGLASGTKISDAPSGFRAFSRNAAMQMNVFSNYSYTLETIIQAGQKGMTVKSVPIKTNTLLRPSRLMKSIPSYIRLQVFTIIRIFMTYRSFRFFALPGIISFIIGFIISLRFIYYYLMGNGVGHVQSLLLATLLMGVGFFLVVSGLLADLISVNRKLLEKITSRVQKIEESINQKNEQ